MSESLEVDEQQRQMEWNGYALWGVNKAMESIMAPGGPTVADVRELGAECLLSLKHIGPKRAEYICTMAAPSTHYGRKHWSQPIGRYLTMTACGQWHATIGGDRAGQMAGELGWDGDEDWLPTCPKCRASGDGDWGHLETGLEWRTEWSPDVLDILPRDELVRMLGDALRRNQAREKWEFNRWAGLMPWRLLVMAMGAPNGLEVRDGS